MEDFDALLAELAPLAKAMAPADGDAKIKAAAEEGGAEMPPADGGEDGGEGAGTGTEEDDVLGKSFAVTLPDGRVEDAFDATELVKSLAVRLDASEATSAQQGTALQTAEANLAKALSAASMLVGMVKAQHARASTQDDLIKSLQADVTRIGNQPTGRKTLVAITEKPSGAPTVAAGPNPNEIMAKAMTVQASGGLMASDIARLEAHFNSGLPAPADILARIPA